DRAGHRVKHRRVSAGRRVDDADLEGDLEADERPEKTREHEVPVLDPGDADAGLPGPELVAAGGDRMQPPPGPGEQDGEDGRQDDGPGDLGPRKLADPVTDTLHVFRDALLLRV